MIQTELTSENIPHSHQCPQHIAIIMDGNGRWAQARGLPRTAGHKAGVNALRDVVQLCAELQIKSLTVFAFSSENWSRPLQEVHFLLNLFTRVLQREVQRLYEENIRVRVVGDCSRFSPSLQALIQNAESLTENNTGLQLNIAANYGGRWDIKQAMQKIAQRVMDQQMVPADITEEEINKYMSLADIPAPDLLIRTSGEQRLSNFLLWQVAYAELYFTPVHWPDFNKKELLDAIKEYAARQRRFGLTASQVIQQVQGA